ncbi:hypothetical protein JX266_005413 [Neoarthrinium moseri]|nr:hypothetical protein JX266_005413 [Neoarthrinium moseri]
MLPSRGIAGLRPVIRLPPSLVGSRQITSRLRASARPFSQLQRAAQSSRPWAPAPSAALRGSGGALPRLAAVGRNPARVGVAAGASRSLSLWPFGSKPQQQPNEPKAEAAPTPSMDQTSTAQPTPPPVDPQSSASQLSSVHETSIPQRDPISTSFSPETFADLEASSILDIPEQIGYLKHLGLDFGWGPTAVCQWLVEHAYIYTGLPWWGTIALVAVAVRVAVFWPTMVGSKHSARMALLQTDPEYVKANAEMKELMWNPEADNMQKMKARAKVMALTKRQGVSMFKTVVTPLAIVPFSYGMFRLLRSMAALPVPSLETGGFAWISDLTVYDPTYVLPLATAAISFLTMKQTQQANLNPTPQSVSMGKFLAYGLTPLMFVCTMWFPAVVQWFFFMFAVTSTAQTTAVLNPAVRRWAGIPSLAEKPALPSATIATYQAPTPGGFRGLLDGASKNVANMQKGIEDYTGGAAKASARKAQEYEKKRAQEEKEKALNRMIEHRRKKLHRQDGSS